MLLLYTKGNGRPGRGGNPFLSAIHDNPSESTENAPKSLQITLSEGFFYIKILTLAGLKSGGAYIPINGYSWIFVQILINEFTHPARPSSAR